MDEYGSLFPGSLLGIQVNILGRERGVEDLDPELHSGPRAELNVNSRRSESFVLLLEA